MTSRRSASLNLRVMISPVYLTSRSVITLGSYLCSCSWTKVRSSGLEGGVSWTAFPFFPLSALAGTTGALGLTSILGAISVFWTEKTGGGGGVAAFFGVMPPAAVGRGFCFLQN